MKFEIFSRPIVDPQTGPRDPSSDVLPFSNIRHDLTETDLLGQCIFASMLCHSDVRLRHQISGTKGLKQCI